MTPTGLCARAFPPLFLVERERERALSVCGKSLPSEKKGGNERERESKIKSVRNAPRVPDPVPLCSVGGHKNGRVRASRSRPIANW